MHGTYHLIPKNKADKFDLLKIFQFIAENNAVAITSTNLPKDKDFTSVKNYPEINLFFGSLTEFKEISPISKTIGRTLLETNKNL
jgi:hypothetical protein